MSAYGNMPRNPYGFLGSRPVPRNPYGFQGSRPVTNPVIDYDGRTGPVSSYFNDGNREGYLMTVETTVQRIPPPYMPAESFEVPRDRPQIVDEFLKKIQTEVSQPAWPPATYQSPYEFPRAAPMVQYGPTTRVDFSDFTNGMPRSVTESGFVVQSPVTPPTIRTTPAPPRPNAKISRAMNDIAESTEYSKEFARPSISNNDKITMPQNMATSLAAVNKGSEPETIDSREAARRYKNVIVSMEPYGKEISTPMLDSKTAKDKYRGVFV